MPAKRQTIVDANKTPGGMGPLNGGSTVNTALMESIFAGSPIYDGSVNDDERISFYQNDVLDAEINDGGHTFGTYNTNYADNGAPDYGSVETGGGGLPASAWVPNPASAPEGDPTAQPAPPPDFGQTPTDTPFMGLGSQEDPSKTSAAIADTKLGDYLMNPPGTPLYPGS
tara:strand:- start:3092 stop:3601 length:510 start_codon:yes stop_codon:yes gene_type:complete